jgi:glycosyltransferase involved in cell wall biosynthesis
LKGTGEKSAASVGGPLVSVITITYNSAKYLDETIRSVVGQDYPRVEYIIVDGGSTDGTLDIVRKYTGKIAKWISEPDRGISDAMNKGIGMSSGDIVGIIHSDDFYADSTVLSRVADVFIRHPEVEALYGIQDYIDPDTGEILLTWGRDADPSEIKKRMYIPHPTLFVRREVYDAIGLFKLDYRVAMDYEFALRLTKHTRPRFLNYKIACMRDMGASGKQFMRVFREVARALTTHGYYFAAFLAVMRNSLKQILIWLGLKGLLMRLWERNVSPR